VSVRHGDLFDVLPTLSETSIDACVTDPPYELAFMAFARELPRLLTVKVSGNPGFVNTVLD
jgi:DNA modification methylase